MDGFRVEPSAFRFKDEKGGSFEWPTCVVCGRIYRKAGITTDEFSRLRAITQHTQKVTMPSPSAFHFFRLNEPADPAVYPNLDGYWDDLINVYRAEIVDLARLGRSYIQLDEVPLAMLCDALVREQVKTVGGDPEAPARGRFLAAALCAGVQARRARPRQQQEGGTRVADDLRRRIDDAAKFVSLDRLALSPQCGFASVAGGNVLSEAESGRSSLSSSTPRARCGVRK